jgi:hypothetical protein
MTSQPSGADTTMTGLMSPVIGSLAYELAAGLADRKDILQKYGVSIALFRQLMALPVFQDMLRKAKSEFGSLASTPDRVRLKAQLMTEMGLQDMWGIINSPRAPEAARVSAYNSVKSLTGMDKPEDAAPMQRFSLKIVLPAVSSATPATITIEGNNPDVSSDSSNGNAAGISSPAACDRPVTRPVFRLRDPSDARPVDQNVVPA